MRFKAERDELFSTGTGFVGELGGLAVEARRLADMLMSEPVTSYYGIDEEVNHDDDDDDLSLETLIEIQLAQTGVEAYTDWFAEFLIRKTHPEFWSDVARPNSMAMTIKQVSETVEQRITTELLALQEPLIQDTVVFRGDGDLQFHPNLELAAGDVLPVEDFLSTSSERDIAKSFIEYRPYRDGLDTTHQRRLLEIIIPAGTEVVDVNKQQKTYEDEIILYKGQLQVLDCQTVSEMIWQLDYKSPVTFQVCRCRYLP